jgi:energy-coupling factor transporter ATP-binding protein EcfA2
MVIDLGSLRVYGPLPNSRPTLPPGAYYLSLHRTESGTYPAFAPVVQDNDTPVRCSRAVDDLVAEMTVFLSQGPAYSKFGFAHKRGYLLHGPPGCGKSSALRLLSKQFLDTTGGVVFLVKGGQSIEPWLNEVRGNEGNRPVLAIAEDVDDDIEDFETSLLEFLDGARRLTNFVFVATTNNLDSVPDRIKHRPSRIDRLVEIAFPDHAARSEYLGRFPLEGAVREDIAKHTDGVSMADLKEVVIASQLLGQTVEDAAARVKRAPSERPAAGPSEISKPRTMAARLAEVYPSMHFGVPVDG